VPRPAAVLVASCRLCTEMLEGYQVADIVPTFGSVNMIGGECDR
jgi:NADH:ubiquinone oxidoreductase subunit D